MLLTHFRHLITGLCLLSLAVLFSYCSDEDFTDSPNDKLEFSIDTLSFDTVFVQMGSATYDFRVYNPHDSRIRVSKIKLAGGEASPFRININGINSTEFNDVEIWAKDSIHVFVEVTVDPTAQNLPFIVNDSIVFETNGNTQDVKLRAYGQNAHFFGPNTPHGTVIGSTGDTVWTNDLPYVIFDYVVVDSLRKLSIQAGTQIHMHNGAVFLVKGTLDVQGGIDTLSKVIFQGTRLDNDSPYDYREVPGQWYGIYFDANSVGNHINGAIIKNGYNGITVGQGAATSINNSPNLVIENTNIRNMAQLGIYNVSGVLLGGNCLVYNCGRHNFMASGGVSVMGNCTFVNNNNALARETPLLKLSSYFNTADFLYVAPLQAHFTNCIIFGEEVPVENELAFEKSDDSSVAYEVLFENCVIKTKKQASDTLVNCVLPPFNAYLFDNASQNDYTPGENSPCRNSGKSNYAIDSGTGIVIDLSRDYFGNTRVEPWDIGCIERQ